MAWGDAKEAENPLKKPFGNLGNPKNENDDGGCGDHGECGGCGPLAKTVTHVGPTDCQQIDGKWYLVHDVFKYEMVLISKSACASDNVYGLKCISTEKSVPFFPIPQLFKAPQEGEEPCLLPSFNGVYNVFVEGSDESVPVYGGQPVPENMIGALACINGELCYLGSSPAQAIPDEVWCNESEPTDPSIELWIFNGITKVKNPEGQWVQTKAYGA